MANKYGVTVSDIKKLNNLKTNTLQIGQVLKKYLVLQIIIHIQ
ncbi:MAG: LysM peptidoglycan-binding domain-containing protein [Clostridium sp.]|nr:MAG: LysM peptidoglycan-binding domain-containing protein [Clostridium sp.]